MATKKSKTSKKSTASSAKSKTATKTAKKPDLEATKTKVIEKKEAVKKKAFKGFFGRKYEEKESILTVFKSRRFYGALIGEILGTMLLSLVLLSVSLMGVANIATYSFAIIAIIIAVYAFSGACLNPIITAGMMATRRVSVIRGVMYIIAEIIGAWIGWLIFNAFHLAGGETAYDIPAMAAIAEGKFWVVAFIEILGATIIGFVFARALTYKRSVFTVAATVAGGISLAVVVGYVLSAAFLGLNNNFVYNPAVAIMLKIFPTSGDNFGEILGGICQALSAYAILPMLGGIAGFYLADFTDRMASEE